MSVTKDDVKELHAKIDQHRNDVYQEISKPLNDLTVKLGELIMAFKSHEKDKERLESNQMQQGKDISELRRDYAALRLETLVAIKELSTNQNGILSVAGKLAVPLLGLASTASAVMIYLKMG